MPGLVPDIHVLQRSDAEIMDGRDKPGHDEWDRVAGSVAVA
jgi:hypothetical protein